MQHLLIRSGKCAMHYSHLPTLSATKLDLQYCQRKLFVQLHQVGGLTVLDWPRLGPMEMESSWVFIVIPKKKQHKNVINYYAEVSSIIIKLLFQILVRSVLSSYAASQLNIDVTQVTRLFNISSGIKTTPLQFHICMI